MKTIDWTKPVEAKINGKYRPAMMLYELGNDAPYCFAVTVIANITAMFSMNDPEAKTLRNVAPPKPKPVLLEGWLNLYQDKSLKGTLCATKREADDVAREDRVECRRIAWMSDGSPVEEDPVRYGVCETCVEKAVKSADEWRTKAEAIRVEVDRLRTDRNACLDQINALNNDIEDMRSGEDDAAGKRAERLHFDNLALQAGRDHWKFKAETAEVARDEASAKVEELQAEVETLKLLNGTQLTRIGMLKTEVGKLSSSAMIVQLNAENKDLLSVIDRMRPVVNAAVAWEKAPPTANAARLWGRVTEAVRTYEAKQADPVVKLCGTCKWGDLPTRSEPCWSCRSFTKWDPSHD